MCEFPEKGVGYHCIGDLLNKIVAFSVLAAKRSIIYGVAKACDVGLINRKRIEDGEISMIRWSFAGHTVGPVEGTKHLINQAVRTTVRRYRVTHSFGPA
jgi:hypothetical protein